MAFFTLDLQLHGGHGHGKLGHSLQSTDYADIQ